MTRQQSWWAALTLAALGCVAMTPVFGQPPRTVLKIKQITHEKNTLEGCNPWVDPTWDTITPFDVHAKVKIYVGKEQKTDWTLETVKKALMDDKTHADTVELTISKAKNGKEQVSEIHLNKIKK